MNNRFVLLLAVCVVGFFGIIFVTKKDNSSKSSNPTNSNQTSDHKFNEGKTGVTLVEYGDFECPACYKFYPVIEQVKEQYKDKVTFQFKNFPLVEIHQNALIASRAAEAANMQGKFTEMYNKLYTEQPNWSKASDPTTFFEAYAKALGLDVEKFKTDLKSEATNQIVQADRSEAKGKGYSSTPTFEIDGQQLTDARDTVEYFSQKLDEAIAKKQKNGQ